MVGLAQWRVGAMAGLAQWRGFRPVRIVRVEFLRVSATLVGFARARDSRAAQRERRALGARADALWEG